MNIISSSLKYRKTIYTLSLREYEKENKGAILGVLWNYLQPLLFVSVLFFIFTSGFKVGSERGAEPFSVYLLCGIVPWLYFSSTIGGITNIIKSYGFLVKKVDFDLSVLPVVKLISSMRVHFFLLLVAVAIVSFFGSSPSIYIIQLIYYFFSMVVLIVGLGLITSSLNLFFKDVGNLVQVMIQFGFWLTPIFWYLEDFSEKAQSILSLNPMAYIVTGYRDSLFSGVWFWERQSESVIFWSVAISAFVVGNVVFRRLQPHFPEVV